MTRNTNIKQPKNWPKEIEFLTTNKLHPSLQGQPLPNLSSLPPPILLSIHKQQSPLPPISPHVSIRKITDESHPAYGESGLFASKSLPPKSLLLTYTGLLSPSKLASTTSNYTLSFLSRSHNNTNSHNFSLTIDAEYMGNESRFLNDYRGIGESKGGGPNVGFEEYWCSTSCSLQMGIFVLSRKIEKNQEILINYGKGFWKSRGLLRESM